MHKIMLEDAATKDVFREMDGFLVVMSVLSTLQAVEDEVAKTEVLEATRLAFVMLSESLEDHVENKEYFKVCIILMCLAVFDGCPELCRLRVSGRGYGDTRQRYCYHPAHTRLPGISWLAQILDVGHL